MNSYLYVKVNDIPILLEGNSVFEIISSDNQKASLSSGHIEWRGSVLPIVSVREMLEMDERISVSESVGVVYRVEEKQLAFLLVDQVEYLTKLKKGDFRPLLGIPKKTAEYFDHVYCEEDKCAPMAYLLKQPIPMHHSSH